MKKEKTTAEKYLKLSPIVSKYFDVWVNSRDTHFGHQNDADKFYRFVRACMRAGYKSKGNGSWLRPLILEKLAGKFPRDYIAETIQKAISIYDHIRDYEKVSFPEPLTEMKNPFEVMSALGRYTKYDHEKEKEVPAYSDEEIMKIISDNFGPNWKEDFHGGYYYKSKKQQNE